MSGNAQVCPLLPTPGQFPQQKGQNDMSEIAVSYQVAGRVGASWRCLNCGMRLGTITVTGRCRLRTWKGMRVELGEGGLHSVVQCPICGAWRPYLPKSLDK